MADIRINALTTTATSSASDDFIAIDGAANGTRKLSVYSPTFGGNVTVQGTSTVTNQSFSFWDTGDRTTYGYFEIGHFANGTFLGSVAGSNASSNLLRFGTSGTERFRLAPSGGINIGATTDVAAGSLSMTGNLTVSGTGTSSVAGPFTAPNLTVYDPSNTFAASFRGTGAANTLVAIGTVTGGAAINAYTSTFSATAALLLQPNGGNLLLGTTTDGGQKLQVSGTASISGALSIGNTVTSAISVASTHKVTISIGGVTYYLLASNV